MPTKVDPIQPPKVTPAYERPSLPIEAWGGLVPQQLQAPPPRPDVSKWVEKANARLDGNWQENEVRGGRLFLMPGASLTEANEVSDVFRHLWDVGMFRENGSPMLIFKPRRDTKIKR